MQRDDDVRSSCFASLDVLCATFGEDLPYAGGLAKGFAFRGRRVPFLRPREGFTTLPSSAGRRLSRSRRHRSSPYGDEEVELGFRYAYQAGAIDNADNRALRAAFALQVPLVYFVATRPHWYEPIYPCYIAEDNPALRSVIVTNGRMIGPLDEREPAPFDDSLERGYAVRETRVRLHQARFRGRVLMAYRDSCAVCRLKELRLTRRARTSSATRSQEASRSSATA